MIRALPFVLVCALFAPFFPALSAQDATHADPVQTRWKGREQQLIFSAVLDGLYWDGVSNEIVDAICAMEGETGWPINFVYGCPICMPALDACRAYRKRPEFFGQKAPRSNFGKGLSEETRSRILSKDIDVRLPAIEELILRWIDARLADLRLTPEEQEHFEGMMSGFREKGMAMLEGYRKNDWSERGVANPYKSMKECAFCNGAARAAEKR